MKYHTIIKHLIAKTTKDTKKIIKKQKQGLIKAFNAYMKETN